MNTLISYMKSRLYFLVLSVLIPSVSLADVAPADFRQKASDKVWEEKIRSGVFQDQVIIEGAAQNVIELKAPFRAEDASIVPISVHAKMPQDGDLYVEKIHIYVDKNPLPLVGIFEFGPASGQADLAMRIRVDDFSYVRAIATLNNGELYMAKSFVRASGACSAPPPKSIEDSIANLGKMKMKTIGDIQPDKPNLVQLKILHPNITGLQPLRVGSRVMPPPHFVKEVDVDYNGQKVLKAALTFSVSMDPALRFFFVPDKAGVITVKGSDTKNNQFSHQHEVSL